MTRRSWAAVVGLFGGILVFTGGLIRFLSSVSGLLSSPNASELFSAFLPFVVTAALGLVVLWVCRPRLWWWPGRRLWNAVLLIGLLIWFVSSLSIVTLVGIVLVIVAGFLLLLEGLVFAHLRPRGLFRRRLF